MSLSAKVQAKKTKIKNNPWSTHPRVRHFVHQAINRAAQLLDLYDSRIKQLNESIDTESTISLDAQIKADKTLLSLTRMARNLQQDLQQYTAVLYPNRSEQVKQEQTDLKASVLSDQLDSTAISEREKLTTVLSAADISIADRSDREDFKNVLGQAHQFASTLNLPSVAEAFSSSDSDPLSFAFATPSQIAAESNTPLLGKERKKQEKFSQAFFKRPVAATQHF